MKRTILGLSIALVALSSVVGVAAANQRNSIQPAHVYYGTLTLGEHANKLVTVHNGTGQQQVIETITFAGAGGRIFTNPVAKSTCHLGTVLTPGARCQLDVRANAKRVGWHRSVLRVIYASGVFGSAELRVHVVA
jgi:hypothetical protein